jgi:hypothetical protein
MQNYNSLHAEVHQLKKAENKGRKRRAQAIHQQMLPAPKRADERIQGQV